MSPATTRVSALPRSGIRLTFVSGYHGDVNGTYPVGKISEESEKLIRTTRLCLDEAIKICKPGALFRDIGKVMYVLTYDILSTFRLNCFLQ